MGKGAKRMTEKRLKFGISTACLYPMETEKALETLGELGVRRTEIFINDITELEDPIAQRILEIKERYQMEVMAVHSCFCPMDHFLLFSDYERRKKTGFLAYEALFSLAARLSAPFVIFHGDRADRPTSPEKYAGILKELSDLAAKHGCLLLQENVFYTKCGNAEFLAAVQQAAETPFPLVLDTKQARRSGVDPAAFLARFSGRICYLHYSARDEKGDCRLPSKDSVQEDFFWQRVGEEEAIRCVTLEVYRDAFCLPKELCIACDRMQNVYQNATGKEILSWNQTV